jgi:hypothetical protein
MGYRFVPHCFCWEISVAGQTYGLELGFAALPRGYGAQAIQSKIQTCSCANERHSGGSWIPPGPVVKEWLTLPNRQSMLSGVPESRSFLVDKLNAGFPPGPNVSTDRFDICSNMISKRDGHRRTAFRCYRIRSIASSASFTSPNCADSSESLVFVNKPDNKLVLPASMKSSISRRKSKQTQPHVEIDMFSRKSTIFLDCNRVIVTGPRIIESNRQR